MVFDQDNFSSSYSQMYDKKVRINKANKGIAVIKEFLKDTKNLNLLDLGCSTGIMTNEYAKNFQKTIGIDIDESAIKFANNNYKDHNLEFLNYSHNDKRLKNEMFDVITCTHIYEHVESPEALMNSVYRLLKPGGVCYFVAGNRYKIVEPHFKLPFLSFFNPNISKLYIKLFNKKGEYYQKHLSLFKLRKLVDQFRIYDYTLETIKKPEKYFSNDLVKDKTLSQKIYLLLGRVFYFMIPTYIWILKKETINKDYL